MNLADQRVLITGVTGFIGGRLARRLRGEGQVRLRGLTRDPAKARDLASLGVEVVRGDLSNPASIARAVEGCSVVIHAAAQVSSVPEREIFAQSNVQGTENLLRAVAAAGVQRFVHLSSIAVFGLATSGEITEQSPRGHSGDPYCDTKFEAEELVLRYHREGHLP